MTGDIHVQSIDHAIRLLVIDNPPANPLGPEMRDKFVRVLDEVEKDDALRCLVVTAEGNCFCSGDDLKAARKEGAPSVGFAALIERLDKTRVPVIAAVNGWCIGGGFELALCCDIRIASTKASFIAAGVNMGLMASAYRLPRLIGVSRAKHILLTGLPVDAAAAERFGLVTALHEPDALRPAAIELAKRIASRAPLSTEATKKFSARAMDLSLEEAGPIQARELAALRASRDHAEAVAAFRERREPRFERR